MLTRAGIILDTYKNEDIDLNELLKKGYRVCISRDLYRWTKQYEIGTIHIFKNAIVWEEEKLYCIRKEAE